MMEMVSTRRAQSLRRCATQLRIQNRYSHTKTHTNTKPHTLTHSTYTLSHPHSHSLTHELQRYFCECSRALLGPCRPAKDRSRDVDAFCVQFHQNRPNINEMAAFQSLAIHLLKNDGNGFDTKGSAT